jgi:plastocyanin
LVTVIAADFTAFHVVGIVLACWAVVLTYLGIRRPDFPGAVKGGGERAVLGISVVLAAGAVGTAIVTGEAPEVEHPEAEHAAEEANPEPSPTQGQGAPTPTQQGASQLKLTADPTGQLKFNTSVLSAKAGALRITLTNPSAVPHNVTLKTPQGTENGKTVGKGGSSTVLADLRAGKYAYYCSVAGHQEGGMEGTLTVR